MAAAKIALQEVIRRIETMAPPEYAASWDNTGLQIGAPDHPVRGVLVALDVTPGVVREATGKKADLIVSHHPLLFHPLQRIRTDSGAGRLLQALLREGIAVYAAHTNLDVVRDGVSHLLSAALGVQGEDPIEEISGDEGIGWGRIGELRSRTSFAAFTAHLKKSLGLKWIRVIGRPLPKVKRIACCSGSGAGLFPQVVRHRPDLFITGDIKYHEALAFLAEGITVLDIGHFASEQGIRRALARRIRRSLEDAGRTIPVHTSRSERDPFAIL